MKFKDFWGEPLIFLISLAIRLPALGWDIFNADAFRWKARSYQFSTGIFSLDFAKTAQSTHPGVSLMGLSTLAIKIYGVFNEFFRAGQSPGGRQEIFELHFVQKLILVIAISLLISLSFYLLKYLTNYWVAFLSMFLLIFEPYFLAHTRIYHLDALLAMLMFVSVLVLLNCLFAYSLGPADSPEAGSEKFPRVCLFSSAGPKMWFFLSAVFAALALLTKSTALFLIPFAVLVFVIRFYSRNVSSSERQCSFLVTVLFWLLVTAAAFAAVWPAMWVQPLKTLSLYFSGITGEGFVGHGQVVFGQTTTDPGWFFYLLSLWIRLSPWMLGLAGLGLVNLIGTVFRDSNSLAPADSPESGSRVQRERAKFGPEIPRARLFSSAGPFLQLISFLFILLYLIFISIPSKKLERYTLPVYPFLAVLAGCGVYRLKELFGKILDYHRQNPKPDPAIRRVAPSNDRGEIRNPKQYQNSNVLMTKTFRILCFVLRIFDPVAVGVVLAFFLISTCRIFPDYLAYYSPLAGGLRGGIRAIQPDWVIGAWRVGEYLNQQPGVDELWILAPNPEQFRPFISGIVRDIQGVEVFEGFDGVVLPVWSPKASLEGLEPEYIVEITGVPVYNIYLTRR